MAFLFQNENFVDPFKLNLNRNRKRKWKWKKMNWRCWTSGNSSRHRSSSSQSWSGCSSPSSSRRSYRSGYSSGLPDTGYSSGLPDTGSLEIVVPESLPTTPVRRNVGASLYWTARVLLIDVLIESHLLLLHSNNKKYLLFIVHWHLKRMTI